jgi:tetraacyldisaccharide 4'-kinase
MFRGMQWLHHPIFKKIQNQVDRLNVPEVTRQQMPNFWRKLSPWSALLREFLLPLTVIYYAVFLWKKSKIQPEKLSVPVWCVGNVTAGGSGKTPFAMMLAQELQRRGKKPAFLTRGFGGMVRTEVVKVDPKTHTAREVGDEPLLLARVAPCYVATSRIQAGRKAIADGADILIMDDGLQHFTIHKDISFMLVDGTFGFGNQGIIPGGPLREPPFKAYARSDVAVLVGEDTAKPFKKFPLPENLPLHNAKIEADAKWLEANQGIRHQKFHAFAGIALPDKFFQTLQLLGFELVEKTPYPDHYYYMPFELDMLFKRALNNGATLITTEKDAVRIPPEFRDKIVVFPAQMTMRDPQSFSRLLDSFLSK